MTITVKWDNEEKTICRWIFADRWTWDEIIEADSKTHELYDTVEHKVHNIIDLSQTTYTPPGLMSRAPQIARMLQGHPNDASPIIIVGASNFVSQLVVIFDKVYHGKIKSITTLEEAYTIADNARRESL